MDRVSGFNTAAFVAERKRGREGSNSILAAGWKGKKLAFRFHVLIYGRQAKTPALNVLTGDFETKGYRAT